MIKVEADTYYSYQDMAEMTGLTKNGVEKRAKRLKIYGIKFGYECILFGTLDMLRITRNY